MLNSEGEKRTRKTLIGWTSAILLLLLIAAVCTVAQTGGDRYPAVRDGALGFIDSAGQEIIVPRFIPIADMARFSEGLAPVVGVDGAGYIDESGRFVIGPKREWGQPRPFHEGIAGVLIWGKNGESNAPAFIDRSGDVVFASRDVDGGSYFSEGLMPLTSKGKWGFVDKGFRWIIPPKYDWAEAFSGGLAPIEVGRKWGYIDKNGNEIVPPKYDLVWQFSDGLGRVRIDTPTGEMSMTVEGPRPIYRSQYGFIDPSGMEAIRPQFELATNFQEGRAFATPPGSKLSAIIDKRGNALFQPAYERASEFHEGLAAAYVGGNWGYVDLNGSWAIAPQFSSADDFWHGLARVAWKDGHGYIDKTGRTVWKVTPAGEAQERSR